MSEAESRFPQIPIGVSPGELKGVSDPADHDDRLRLIARNQQCLFFDVSNNLLRALGESLALVILARTHLLS